MPHLQDGQLLIPFGGRSPRSRRTSLQGARVVNAGSQAARMLLAYVGSGPLTDLQMAARLGLPESRISARRSGLIQRGLVTWSRDVRGPHGADNGAYSLTAAGWAVATELERSMG